MEGILDLGLYQQESVIKRKICYHSKAFITLFPAWRGKMDLPTTVEIEKYCLFQNEDQKTVTLKSGFEDGLFLGAFQEGKIISLLHTINKKMENPYCSKCSTRPCPCFAKFRKSNNREDNEDENEVENEDEKLPWTKEKNTKVPVEHFENKMNLNDWYSEYGCNITDIKYPIKRDPIRQDAWTQRKLGKEPDFPEKIIPEYQEKVHCIHNNKFSLSEKHLKKINNSVIVYMGQSEKIFDKEVYARGTGACRCLQQVDGDQFQQWHIKHGRFIDYTYLNSYIIRHSESGNENY